MDNSRLEALHAMAFELIMNKRWMMLCGHPDELAAVLAAALDMVTDGCRHLPETNHEELVKRMVEFTANHRDEQIAKDSN